jgi:hypothetical protein
MPAQRRPVDRISNKEEAVAVAQESEFLAVNQKIRVRIPAVTPFHNARDSEIVEAAVCKTELPAASPGCASISGPSSNSKTTRRHRVDRGAIPVAPPFRTTQRVRAFSPIHRPPSSLPPPRRKTAIRAVRIGETLGAARSRPPCRPPLVPSSSSEMPDHFNSAKALVATHAAGIGERPVQLRLADHVAL